MFVCLLYNLKKIKPFTSWNILFSILIISCAIDCAYHLVQFLPIVLVNFPVDILLWDNHLKPLRLLSSGGSLRATSLTTVTSSAFTCSPGRRPETEHHLAVKICTTKLTKKRLDGSERVPVIIKSVRRNRNQYTETDVYKNVLYRYCPARWIRQKLGSFDRLH